MIRVRYWLGECCDLCQTEWDGYRLTSRVVEEGERLPEGYPKPEETGADILSKAGLIATHATSEAVVWRELALIGVRPTDVLS